MVYEGWSLEIEMLERDEWYNWDDFVHFVRYRLSQLSFTYDRRAIRQQLDLPRSLRQIHNPFRKDARFPVNKILINTSFEVDLCIRRILSAIDIPDFGDYSGCSNEALNVYNKSKELYYYHLNELYELTNFSDNLLTEKGVFNQLSFENRNSLKWKDTIVNSK